MSPSSTVPSTVTWGFPGASGDESERIDDYSYTVVFSPRERGWARHRRRYRLYPMVFPS